MTSCKYRVFIDFKNFIPIDESELSKALNAFAGKLGVIFENGATDKITAILPDYNAMMGWNSGYVLNAEDYSCISSNKVCVRSRSIIRDGMVKLQTKTTATLGVGRN